MGSKASKHGARDAEPPPAKNGLAAHRDSRTLSEETGVKKKTKLAHSTWVDEVSAYRCRLNTSGRPRVLKALVFQILERTSLSIKPLVSNIKLHPCVEEEKQQLPQQRASCDDVTNIQAFQDSRVQEDNFVVVRRRCKLTSV